MNTETWRSELCRTIIEHTSEAVMFADRQGIILLWNRGAELMFGYPAEEAIGKSLDLIIPDNLRERHWDGYHRVMEDGESRYSTQMLSAPALRKDGSRISTEFSMVMVKDSGEKVLGVAAVIRDVSSRWTREKELKDRIRELEAQFT